MATPKVPSLGEYIRQHRNNAQYSLRELAQAAGVSNPYLSQIERDLRKPSAEILMQIAKALRISAEALYVQAGILEERSDGQDVTTVILADPALTERQRRVLLDIYESFRRENEANAPDRGSEKRAGAPRKRISAKAPLAENQVTVSGGAHQ